MKEDDWHIIPIELRKRVPEQRIGRCTDTYSSIKIEERNTSDAVYASIKNRLLHVNNWSLYAHLTNTDFILLDKNGNNSDGWATEGSFIKIRFSKLQKIFFAPYDFVHIAQLVNEPKMVGDALVMQLRPAHNPKKKGNEIDHFFTSEASNTFILYRDATKIYLSLHGRNEKINLNVAHLAKKMRNITLATFGILGISNLQWKSLAEGLLNDK